jgi:NAD(P)-dependent dehydrogenase (short-subunit alcohol dehydrogenase family)
MTMPSRPAPDRDAAARMFGLGGRVAIVTGASSGLGASVAGALAALGARVAVVARRRDRLAELATRIGGLAVACDLSDLERIGSVIPAVAEGLGPPEIFVNAAGKMFTAERGEQGWPVRPDRRARRAVGAALDPGEYGGPRVLPQRDH